VEEVAARPIYLLTTGQRNGTCSVRPRATQRKGHVSGMILWTGLALFLSL
jgi:hypothetical protein